MTTHDSETQLHAVDFDKLPSSLAEGSVLLVAKPAPLEDYALTLRLLDRYTSANESRIIVTTDVDADETIRQQLTITPQPDGGRFGIVDATAHDHPSAPFQEFPVVSLQYPVELTRLTLALWELETSMAQREHPTHLGIRSLSPLLESENRDHVVTVLTQLIDQQFASGFVVMSVEYTKHDERTLSALSALADGIIWIEEGTDDTITAEYRRVHDLTTES